MKKSFLLAMLLALPLLIAAQGHIVMPKTGDSPASGQKKTTTPSKKTTKPAASAPAKKSKQAATQTKKPTGPSAESLYEEAEELWDQEKFEEAYPLMKKAAQKGSAIAQFYLGVMYYNGLGVEEDYDAAFEWTKKAAEQDLVEAQHNLGLFYLNGRGVEQNDAEAFKWTKKAAEQDHVHAQHNLGLFYLEGRGVEQNDAEAFKWIKKAAEQDHVPAQFILGMCYADGTGVEENDGEAFKWIKKAADQDFVEAQYYLGKCYSIGMGVEKNNAEAIKWYKKAADQGDVRAQYYLGDIYFHGNGVKKDVKQGVELLEKSAEAGYPPAQFALIHYYYEGEGVKKDYAKAREFAEKAAAAGIPQAMMILGDMYEEGKGVTRDMRKAEEWYRKAAEVGYPDAMMNLGEMYEDGKGVAQDMRKAEEWYRKAAEAHAYGAAEAVERMQHEEMRGLTPEQYAEIGGRLFAQKKYQEAYPYIKAGETRKNRSCIFMLGRLYTLGKPVEQNYDIAERYLKSAADLGDPEACYYLSNLYENIKYGRKDDNKCLEYLRKSANSYAPAQLHLANKYEKGEGVKANQAEANKYYSLAARAYSSLAEKGDEEAMGILGNLYWRGKGVGYDPEKCVALYRKGAKDPKTRAKLNALKKEYELNQGDDGEQASMTLEQLKVTYDNLIKNKEYAQALPYIKEAAMRGSDTAYDLMEMCYLNGLGVAENRDKGEEWRGKRATHWMKKAERGNAEAQLQVGDYYSMGLGLKQSSAKAFQWYMKAAEKGNAQAQYKVGYAYEKGYGVEQNAEKAREWYTKAADQKHTDAKKALKRL